MSRVLVLGNATLDVIQRVERLPAPGETVLALRTARCAERDEVGIARDHAELRNIRGDHVVADLTQSRIVPNHDG